MERLLNNGVAPEPEEVFEVNELEELRDELAKFREDFTKFRASVERDRNQLGAMLHGLRSVFSGGAAPAPSSGSDSNPGPQPQPRAKWESWKRKLGGRQAEFIDALLEHGEMTGKQLMIATRCGQDVMYRTIKQLNQAQLLNKNDGKFSLKEE